MADHTHYGLQCAVYALQAACICAWVLYYFSRSSWRCIGVPTLIAVYVSFLTTIVPVAYLAVDIDAATHSPPDDPQFLHPLWSSIFWLTQLLSWAVMPVLQSCGSAGEFTARGRLRGAVKENLKLYVIMGVVFTVLGVYITIRSSLSASELMNVVIAASNAFGLLCIILFLGYGLAELPRMLWADSVRTSKISRLTFRATELRGELDAAVLKYADLCACLSQVEARQQDPAVQEKLAVIRAVADQPQADEEWESVPERRGTVFDDDDDLQDVDFASEDGLVRLHRKAKAVVQHLRGTRILWKELCDEVLYLEDAETQCGEDPRGAARIVSVGRVEEYIVAKSNQDYSCWNRAAARVQWVYQKYLRVAVLRSVAVILGAMSVTIVWCESVALPLDLPDLSPVHLVLSGNWSFGVRQTVIFLLPYAAFTCYWSLFKMKIFESHLLVRRASGAANLCFTSYMLCRLILPLCYNFLLLSFLADATENGAAFSKVYGQMDSVALLGQSFNRFFPCTLALVCVAVATGMLTRCAAAVGFETYAFRGEDCEHEGEGRDLLRAERRTREAKVQHSLAQQTLAPVRGPVSGQHHRLPEEVEV
eukprot:TRINITY_DN1608_c1_g1_i4.p1 TRINITY_DN1608_c1_g1~~TRINITY_DN1608_c1_g1_i4.p1  ORF type:complete len:593 (+),score=204.82 TRINITY_DN1608_c1_g1_i4:64-1842(+)